MTTILRAACQMMPHGEYDDCWNCGGEGWLAGCFEDCCTGADCDPEDPLYCCAPSRCDVCRGKGVLRSGTRDDDEQDSDAAAHSAAADQGLENA